MPHTPLQVVHHDQREIYEFLLEAASCLTSRAGRSSSPTPSLYHHSWNGSYHDIQTRGYSLPAVIFGFGCNSSQSASSPTSLPSPIEPLIESCGTRTPSVCRRNAAGGVICDSCSIFLKSKGITNTMELKRGMVSKLRRKATGAQVDKFQPY
ncbi:hypothetical protein BDR26DRAFT_283087 [Obelidium mucronatum]|nr:hypothetical protein BDR26DRAFT_283087 [Obelidium mucronatum]